MEKASISGKQSQWVLASCPNTGEEVVGSGWNRQFSTPDGQASWWYCPSCGGWHVMRVGRFECETKQLES